MYKKIIPACISFIFCSTVFGAAGTRNVVFDEDELNFDSVKEQGKEVISYLTSNNDNDVLIANILLSCAVEPLPIQVSAYSEDDESILKLVNENRGLFFECYNQVLLGLNQEIKVRLEAQTEEKDNIEILKSEVLNLENAISNLLSSTGNTNQEGFGDTIITFEDVAAKGEQTVNYFVAKNDDKYLELVADLKRGCAVPPSGIKNTDYAEDNNTIILQIDENREIVGKCYSQVLQGLVEKKGVLSAIEDESDAEKETIKILDSDIEKLKDAISKLSPSTKNLELSLRAKIENEEKSERLDRIASEATWYAAFQLGVKMMPEYNAEGDNQGFKETNFFAHFGLDNRSEISGDGFQFWNNFFSFPAFHTGVSVDFLSANIVNCENVPESEQEACREGEKDLNNKDFNFNDVAQTINANMYGWLHFWDSKNKNSELGIGGRVGIQSREKLKDNGDSLNAVYTFGLRYVNNDFTDLGTIKGKYKNGMPRFFLEVSRVFYEDYAGLKTPDGDRLRARTIVMGAYRVKKDLPIYIGLAVNGGEGPDEIALTFTYGLKTDTILGFFHR